MQYTTLGKTGLKVSVAGLGCGGNSRIGQGAGLSEAQSVELVRAARDLGVTFFDTAEVYGTEGILGAALRPSERAEVVISTKSRIARDGKPMTAGEVVANLDASLQRLRTDYVDVFLLHGVAPAMLDHCRNELAPVLLEQKKLGKLRHLGLSETAPNDPGQEMLQRAVDDAVWEVFMLAYHMLNQGARRDVLPKTQARGVGTLVMFVVPNIFSQPGQLQDTIARLAAEGKIPSELASRADPLGFLIHEGGARSLTDAAYRFARHEPGCEVILFGTSRRAHLEANIASILAPPLPTADVARLYDLFSELRGVGLDMPKVVPT